MMILLEYETTNHLGLLHQLYQNYFEFAHESNDWIYYVWSKEDWFNSVDSQELLYKAIQQCKEIDEKNNITKIM